MSNPATCSKNSLGSVCAFVRPDGICVSPPDSWPKQFAKLRVLAGAAEPAAVTPAPSPALEPTAPAVTSAPVATAEPVTSDPPLVP